jgi:hypothetical protein
VDFKIEAETLFVIVEAIARRMERVLSRLLEIMQSELSKARSVVKKFPRAHYVSAPPPVNDEHGPLPLNPSELTTCNSQAAGPGYSM